MRRIIAISALLSMLLVTVTGCLKPDTDSDGSMPDNRGIRISQGEYDVEAPVFLTIQGVDYSGDSPIIGIIWHNTTRYKISFGERYIIERFENGEWVNAAICDKAFPEIALMLKEHGVYNKSYPTNWVDISKEGTYRLRTSYILHHDDANNYTDESIFVEFTVKKQ